METPEWTQKYFGSITKSLALAGAEGVLMNFDTGVVLTQNLSEEGYQNAFSVLATVQSKNRTIATMVDRFLGQLILNYTASRDTTIEEAVSQLDLESRTGKKFKTLAKLPRMVAQLPNEAFMLPNLNTMHFEAVTSFGGPKDDVNKMEEFNNDRMKLLEKISEDPNQWTKAKVGGAMRDIQAKFSTPRRRGMSLGELMEKFIDTSVIVVDWEADDYGRAGITEEEATAKWREYRELLIEKGYLGENVRAPWQDAVDGPVEAPQAEQGPLIIEAEHPVQTVDLTAPVNDWPTPEQQEAEAEDPANLEAIAGIAELADQEAVDAEATQADDPIPDNEQ